MDLLSAEARDVVYVGVGPHGSGPQPEVGGFESGTRMVTGSRRFRHTTLHFCAYTHPGSGSLPARLLEDCRRLRGALRAHPAAPVVMLQVGYYRSTWRELAVAALARRAGRRVVLDIRGGAVLEFLEGTDPITRRAFGALLRHASLALVQCSAFLPELERRYPGVPFAWFPNFVPSDRCRLRTEPPYARGDTLRVAYAGGYHRAKGVAELVEAVSRLRREERLDLELHLAGEGHDAAVRRAIDAAAGPGIVDHGLLPREALWALLGRMHVFAFPTSHFGEGHSNALNEALMSGLAVVATRHNQNPHVLPPDVTRWLDGDRLVDSLREELRFLASHPEAVERAGQEGLRWIRERFTDEQWIPFLEERLDKVARDSEQP